MPYVKSRSQQDLDVVVGRSEGFPRLVSAKAGEWVEVPDADAKSLEEQGWEVRKTEPGKTTKGGGS